LAALRLFQPAPELLEHADDVPDLRARVHGHVRVVYYLVQGAYGRANLQLVRCVAIDYGLGLLGCGAYVLRNGAIVGYLLEKPAYR
jgi:hypothetical protein